MSSEYEIKQLVGSDIRQRVKDGYLNATDMCKANGKLLSDYSRLQQTKEFVEELSIDMGFPISKIIEIKRGGSRYDQGTWVHPFAAIHLAQWLSPKFSVAVSKWVFRFVSGDPTLVDEMKIQLEEQTRVVEEQKQQLAKLERKQLNLETFVRNFKRLEKTQVFYLATTPSYARQNRFEYGGVKNAKDIKGRIASYNTGRAENDLMYIVKLYKCHNYKDIEDRVGTVLAQFKDKPLSRKEMLYMRFNLLTELVDFICENYDREIDYINAHCQRFIEQTIEQDGIVPEPADLSEFLQDEMNIVVRRRGKPDRTEKIDITGWDDTRIDAVITNVIRRCANDEKKVDYDPEQQDSVMLQLTWSLLTPYFEIFNGLTKSQWRERFKQWYKRTNPQRLTIKGIRC
jgi:hypothetical protein